MSDTKAVTLWADEKQGGNQEVKQKQIEGMSLVPPSIGFIVIHLSSSSAQLD